MSWVLYAHWEIDWIQIEHGFPSFSNIFFQYLWRFCKVSRLSALKELMNFEKSSNMKTFWQKMCSICFQSISRIDFSDNRHIDTYSFLQTTGIVQWAKTGKKFQFQICVWVDTQLPQRLKSTFFLNFHSKKFQKHLF